MNIPIKRVSLIQSEAKKLSESSNGYWFAGCFLEKKARLVNLHVIFTKVVSEADFEFGLTSRFNFMSCLF